MEATTKLPLPPSPPKKGACIGKFSFNKLAHQTSGLPIRIMYIRAKKKSHSIPYEVIYVFLMRQRRKSKYIALKNKYIVVQTIKYDVACVGNMAYVDA